MWFIAPASLCARANVCAAPGKMDWGTNAGRFSTAKSENGSVAKCDSLQGLHPQKGREARRQECAAEWGKKAGLLHLLAEMVCAVSETIA